jgi:UPF0755 protein
MGRWALRLAAVFVILAIAAGALTQWARLRFEAPGPLAEPATLVIAKGSGVAVIADSLAAARVVRSRWDLVVAARLADAGHALKAGEYAFAAGISLKDVLDLLRSGRTVVHRLTVPEGLTAAQVLVLLQAEPALAGDPGALPPEGSLLPETYYFSRGDTRAELIARMTEAMARTVADLWARRSPDLPLADPAQAVTLASIVEKETGIAAERPRIAGVFMNRLKAGMKLQSDPTIIYALTGGKGPLDRPLTRADWQLASPYNTYVVDGLPPGPIANPGRDSLAAVMTPEATDFLYFVADGSGGHAFSASLADHNRNVAHWRAVQKAPGSEPEVPASPPASSPP